MTFVFLDLKLLVLCQIHKKISGSRFRNDISSKQTFDNSFGNQGCGVGGKMSDLSKISDADLSKFFDSDSST